MEIRLLQQNFKKLWRTSTSVILINLSYITGMLNRSKSIQGFSNILSFWNIIVLTNWQFHEFINIYHSYVANWQILIITLISLRPLVAHCKLRMKFNRRFKYDELEPITTETRLEACQYDFTRAAADIVAWLLLKSIPRSTLKSYRNYFELKLIINI